MRKGVICKKTTIMFVMLLRHACIMTSMFTVGLIIQCFREWWSGTRRIRHEVCRALRYIVPFFFSVGVTTNGSKEIHDYVCTQKIRPRGLARHQKYANFLKSKWCPNCQRRICFIYKMNYMFLGQIRLRNVSIFTTDFNRLVVKSDRIRFKG